MLNYIRSLFCKPVKQYRIKIVAQSTNTPTLDCSIDDLMAITKNVHGNDEYVFRCNETALVISEIK